MAIGSVLHEKYLPEIRESAREKTSMKRGYGFSFGQALSGGFYEKSTDATLEGITTAVSKHGVIRLAGALRAAPLLPALTGIAEMESLVAAVRLTFG